MKKKLTTVAVCALVVCGLLMSSGAFAGKSDKGMSKGNEMPSGNHYNLNIIGTKNVSDVGKNVGNSMGHTLFVKLDGRTKIIMTQDLENGEFQVTDRNGLDKDGAAFNIAPGYWDVYARALGKPGGKVNISAYGENETLYPDDLYLGSVELTRNKSKPQTVNINTLFYVTVIIDGKSYNKFWVFDIPELDGYYWDYYNKGLKLVQVRFYENTTHVGPQNPIL